MKETKSKPIIPQPSQAEVQKWLKEWDKLENYRHQENALNRLFRHTYPHNTDLSEILIKVATLNDFYSTSIMNVFAVAKHIKSISHIDERLKKGDELLVAEIANMFIGGKEKHFYSFATKFCSHHNEIDFAIFDRYVESILMHFKNDFKSGSFTKKADLRKYPKFKKILCDFKNRYKIKATFKELDKYLWQLGKQHFPRNKKEKLD